VTYGKVSIKDNVLLLVPEEASSDTGACLHEEDISAVATSSIIGKGLVSHHNIPFQISKHSEESFHDLKRLHIEVTMTLTNFA